jgi:hypothetical protein
MFTIIFYFFSLRQFVIVKFSSSLYYLYSAYILKIFKLILEGIRARSKKNPELHSSLAMASTLAASTAMWFLLWLSNSWSRHARAALPLLLPPPLTWWPLAFTVAADTSISATPWCGSPLASPPATVVVPRYRRGRRLHRDTPHVANICFKYFRYFRNMLQVFHMYVTKVDRDIAHVAWLYTYVFQVYIPNVSSISYICCKCFI